MSMQVPVSELSRHAADYGPGVYVVIGDGDGPARITHSSIRWEGDDIVVGVGGRSVAALRTNPAVSLLWPATADQSMSLIADGIAGEPLADDGVLTIRITGAVRHRPAPPAD